MIRYIYTTIIFLIFVIILTQVVNFNYIQEVENIDMKDQTIDNIVIDLTDANFSITSTVDKDIKIEHIYSKQDVSNSNLYAYQEDGTLYINEYMYNQKSLINKKEVINVYIPEEYQFKTINITNDTGTVSVDNVFVDNLTIESQTGNIDIANSNFDSLVIKGDQFGVNIASVVNNNATINVDKAVVEINNSILDNLNITSVSDSNVVLSKNVANNVIVNGPHTNLTMDLSDSVDYNIITNKSIANLKFKRTDTGYQYKALEASNTMDVEATDVASININLYTLNENNN